MDLQPDHDFPIAGGALDGERLGGGFDVAHGSPFGGMACAWQDGQTPTAKALADSRPACVSPESETRSCRAGRGTLQRRRVPRPARHERIIPDADMSTGGSCASDAASHRFRALDGASHRFRALDGASHRFRALDGARGLCALLVCLFHFKAAGPLAASALVRGGWLCVDFFFVLSGFVIAAGWGGRLERPADLPRFLVLRLARVWPLHLVMLALFLAVELAGAALTGGGIMHRTLFGPGHGVGDWLLSALLLNCFGLTGGPAWNVPAWSIAAEYWSWAIFGLAWVWGGRDRPWLILLLSVAAGVVMLAEGTGLNRSWDGGLARALCGFFAGVVVHSLPRWQPAGRAAATRVELLAVAAALGLIMAAPTGPASLIAPPVFAMVVHALASDAGAVSRLLAQPALQWLGLSSSALYLSHAFVQARLGDVLDLAPRLLPGLPRLMQHGPAGELFGRTAGEGLALTLVMLALALLTAQAAARWVEEPVRRWAWARWHPASVVARLKAATRVAR
ncbi:hypothetical protein CAP39_03660 [Sphingomonas sp. IBVSS1]|nr:hypothetical protein CAP39_03660 [Sphingomonas sp. IBVSS1]